MPYATDASVPPDVRDRFPGHCTTVWRTTFNDTLDRHGDEGRAWATAETAGKLCKESVMPAVKFVKDQPDMIEGLAIPFGGPIAGKDFDGESFSAETDLCLPWFGETGRPILYGHGLNPATKTEVVGRQVSLEELPAALEEMEQRRTTGRTIVMW